jgi:iron complex transport system substrate-binding protein
MRAVLLLSLAWAGTVAANAWALPEVVVGPEDRIVTLGAPATEVIFALGLGDQVVAVDQSSTMPPDARSKPQVGYVRSLSAEGILSLRPTWVVATDDLGPPLVRQQLTASGVRLVVVDSPSTPAEVETIVRELAKATGRQAAAEPIIERFRTELATAAETPDGARPRVVFLMQPPEGGAAPMAAGRGMKADALIQLAGGQNPFQSFTGYKPVGLESLIKADPDMIVVGFTTDEAGADLARRLASQPGWGQLRAVRNRQLHTVALGEALTFGPSLGQAVAQLSAWLRQLPPKTARPD